MLPKKTLPRPKGKSHFQGHMVTQDSKCLLSMQFCSPLPLSLQSRDEQRHEDAEGTVSPFPGSLHAPPPLHLWGVRFLTFTNDPTSQILDTCHASCHCFALPVVQVDCAMHTFVDMSLHTRSKAGHRGIHFLPTSSPSSHVWYMYSLPILSTLGSPSSVF